MDNPSKDIPISYSGPSTDFGFRSLAKTWGDFNNGKGQFNITEEEWYNAFKTYGGLPDFDQILGNEEFKKWMYIGEPPSDSSIEKIRDIIKSASNKPEEKKPIEQVEEVKKKELPKINAEVGGGTATATATATEEKPKEETPTATEDPPEEETIPDPPEPKTEEINETVLGMIGLEPGMEISYQKLFDRIKRKLVSATLVGQRLPEEEDSLLRYELKKIQKLKNTEGETVRIKIKVTQVKTRTDNLPDPGEQQSEEGPTSSAIVKYKKPNYDIVPVKLEYDKEEKKGVNELCEIRKLVESILKTLEGKFKFDTEEYDTERKDKERKQRTTGESILEGVGKGSGAIVGVVEKALSPFQSIIDKLWNFIFYTLLGKAFGIFMDWLSNPQNRKKFDSFVDFLIKHWPALAGIYILFGTGFGGLVRGLLKSVIRMGVALIMNIPKIIGFIRKNKKLSLLGLSAASLASGFIAKDIKEMFQEKKESPEGTAIPTSAASSPDLSAAQTSVDKSRKPQKIPTLKTGGIIPKVGKFAGGGLNSFAPFAGGDLRQGIPITGAGKDDTLAAVSTGEAILTKKDQDDIASRYVDKTTGRPLNIPQYLAGRRPGMVSMNNIRPKFGGGFYHGGVINKYNVGGIIGGSPQMQGGGSINTNISPTTNNKINTQNFNSGGPINVASPTVKMQGGGSINVASPTVKMQGGGFFGGLMGGAQSLWNTVTGGGGRQAQGERQGPQLTPQMIRSSLGRQPGRLTGAAQSLQNERWSYLPNPGVGCAAAINEVYRRAGIPIPWQNVLNTNRVPDIYKFLSTSKNFMRVEQKGRKPGDIVIWNDRGENGDGIDPYGHIGIVMPDGRIANNSTHQGAFVNINTPEDAMTMWPNTVRLLYFRDKRVNDALMNSGRRGAGRAGNRVGRGGRGGGGSSFNLFTTLKNLLHIGGKESGGLITENTGVDIPGATADRQLINVAVQPGESHYIFSKLATERGAVDIARYVEAKLNPNSDASKKFGFRNKNIPQITPYNSSYSGSSQMVTLPPINLGGNNMNIGGQGGGGLNSDTNRIPSFSAVSSNSDREVNAKAYYGIV